MTIFGLPIVYRVGTIIDIEIKYCILACILKKLFKAMHERTSMFWGIQELKWKPFGENNLNELCY